MANILINTGLQIIILFVSTDIHLVDILPVELHSSGREIVVGLEVFPALAMTKNTREMAPSAPCTRCAALSALTIRFDRGL
jgi:hypothetical protein